MELPSTQHDHRTIFMSKIDSNLPFTRPRLCTITLYLTSEVRSSGPLYRIAIPCTSETDSKTMVVLGLICSVTHFDLDDRRAIFHLATAVMSGPTPAQDFQTHTPYKFANLPSKDALVSEFRGKPLGSLRTPVVVIDRSVFAQNCAKMHSNAKDWGASFRAHVKTHKVSY